MVLTDDEAGPEKAPTDIRRLKTAVLDEPSTIIIPKKRRAVG
jgi:hypothetical protein